MRKVISKLLNEIFTVSKIIPRNPPVYKLKDYDGQELEGNFYNQELQKVIKSDDTYVRNIKYTQYYVKWLGYPNKFNSWVPVCKINKS